jgi:hypothetical protein
MYVAAAAAAFGSTFSNYNAWMKNTKPPANLS